MFNLLKKLFSTENKSERPAFKAGAFTPLRAESNKQAVRRRNESSTSDSWIHPVIYTGNSGLDSGRHGGGHSDSGGSDSGGGDGGGGD